MAKILINNTASPVLISDTGVTVPASGQFTIPAQDFPLFAASSDVVVLIGNGTLTVNDGLEDLEIAEGVGLIQGSFIQKDFIDDLKMNNRLKVDVSGSLGDGTVFVSATDGTQGRLDDKIVTGSSKVTKTIGNPGGNETLIIDIDPAEINTTDLNNDAGFITSGQAPVQPGDIADFETSTQLDARDAANRDRANHTGTQLASTISDFTTAVQAAETVTSLSLAANTLSFTDENGTVTNLDLSIYLDDTNLARVVSGVLDANTGIITFTRDDSSTFTIDASALLDNQDASEVPFTPTGNTTSTDVQAAIEELQSEIDLNTPKVSADGSVDTHSDVDVTTTPPNAGDVLAWDGSNFVPDSTDNGFTVFSIWAEENGGLTANSRQWSFGNGATGNINIVLPIEAELFAVSFDNENGTGTVTLEVLQDDVQVFETRQFVNKDFEILSSPVTFTAGQCVGFRTGEDNGNFSDARVAAWFRVRTSMLSGSVLNDLLDVNITGPSTGQGLVYDGTNWTNQVIFDGDYNNLSNRPLLGTAADNDETDFATAAQGVLADSALQSGDNISELVNDANYITSAGAPVQSVNGQTGTVNLTNSDVGLGNVPNVDATDADNITVDAIPNLVATDVQAALAELQGEITTSSDHGNLGGLLDDDHPQYLNEGRHDSLPNDNPHSVTFTQAVTADAGTDISAAEAETLTDGSNADSLHVHTSSAITDFNSAASAAAPVQSADIADFETSTQLDARDAANRDRSNHTGTQTASTISDFVAQVQANETTTTLSFNSNILSYVDEDGTTTNIDLSLYLDDTNLARITSGVLDSGTGIATFTRDDSSTFTVDFSSLNDQAAIAQAIADHEALPDPHPQYTTTAEATAAAPIQSINGQTGTLTGFAELGASGQSFTQSVDFTAITTDALDMQNNVIANVATPVANNDAANKNYVDTLSRVESLNGQTGVITGFGQNSLSDTTITAPVAGQILEYNGTQWVNVTPPSNQLSINQPGHGFTISNNVPLPAYVDTSGVVQLAQANSLNTLSAFYIVEITDVNNFVIQNNGFLPATSHGLSVGEYYFLSDTTAGDITITEPLDSINDVVLFVIDPDTLLLVDNRPEDKNSIEKFLIKVSNTNTTTNINTGTNTEVPITGTTVINENSFYSISGNGIQVPQTRTYSVRVNLHVGGSATRANQQIRLAVNGTPTGPIAASGYIRNTGGHNDSSYFLEDILVLNANDVVTVVSTPEAGGGTVTLEAVGTSTMIVEAR